MSRSFLEALDHLSTVQSIESAKSAWLAAGSPPRQFIITDVVEYLRRIGYTRRFNSLNVIHVTGTKGKGSTVAFTDSILRHLKPDWKIGLYTSPHLVSVRERIRINGAPISESDFAKFFFEVWDKLDANDQRNDPSISSKPSYFGFMTLLAFHVFLSMKVDATILEVGAGGAYSATNIVPKPIVTVVTALGIDHVDLLGPTLGSIAWHKAGIFQAGAPALTVQQPEEGMSVLQEQAVERKASYLAVVSILPQLSDVRLGLAGKHQLQNASLSVQAVQTFLHSQVSVDLDTPLPRTYIEGLQNTRWPGRCQTVPDPKQARTTWFLDGAHTVESLNCCMEWFCSPDVGLARDNSSKQPAIVLLFACSSGRSGPSFLGTLIEKTATQLKLLRYGESRTLFDYVVFCSIRTHVNAALERVRALSWSVSSLNIVIAGVWLDSPTDTTQLDDDSDYLKTPQELAEAWSSLIPTFCTDHIHTLPSIDRAVNLIRDLPARDDRQVNVMVTGSLYLVAGVMKVTDVM